MRKLALAGTLTGALAAYTVPTTFAGEDAAFQHNEDTPDVVTTVDDDDDDSNTGRSGESSTGTSLDDTSASTGTGDSNTGIR